MVLCDCLSTSKVPALPPELLCMWFASPHCLAPGEGQERDIDERGHGVSVAALPMEK